MHGSATARFSRRLGLVCLVLAVGAAGAVFAQDASSSLTADSFTVDFSAMKQLSDLVAKGKGMIGVLLPETTTSARYTAFDAPYLKQAFEAAGLTTDQYIITNAQGDDATELTQAQAAISQGATVLIMDPISTGGGIAIEAYAKERGVPVIDYDRITPGGSRDYWVSFDNVAVGTLIGKGMVSCLAAWNVTDPQLLVMDGAATTTNAALFAQGYNAVLQPHFDDGSYTKVGEPAGTWDPSVARTTFEGQFTAHQEINAVVTPNDDDANAVISYLKTVDVPAKTFPTTGQDATLQGLQNILAGYQCGTVYKPIYLEAQAAAALAIYLRAGATPPTALVNSSVKDTVSGVEVPSILLNSVWVTSDNMAATVVKDEFVTADQLCPGFEDQCKAAGIAQ